MSLYTSISDKELSNELRGLRMHLEGFSNRKTLEVLSEVERRLRRGLDVPDKPKTKKEQREEAYQAALAKHLFA
ncbi:hypothetical protein [Arachidicoccus terrestris]|uniref:hypothetical protein n=1 Tax=Arachidicoccus terrestris TaxID=2875539 RepID=UPI001CC7C06F|nr:hypothetical protein [Arachidicoccus terrestris]UAY56229.1 hypothetical protein K9M52_04215 [Arachidicoccus terrestris]